MRDKIRWHNQQADEKYRERLWEAMTDIEIERERQKEMEQRDSLPERIFAWAKRSS